MAAGLPTCTAKAVNCSSAQRLSDRSIRVALANRQDEDMHQNEIDARHARRQLGIPVALSVGALLALAGCGGGGSDQADAMPQPLSTSTVSAVI